MYGTTHYFNSLNFITSQHNNKNVLCDISCIHTNHVMSEVLNQINTTMYCIMMFETHCIRNRLYSIRNMQCIAFEMYHVQMFETLHHYFSTVLSYYCRFKFTNHCTVPSH